MNYLTLKEVLEDLDRLENKFIDIYLKGIMEELASLFFHSRTQAHVFHLRVKGTGSYAAHKALNKYYDEIIDLIDGLVESYQGKNGLIEFQDVDGIDNNAAIDNIIKYFDKLIAALDKLRKGEKLQDTWIQNELDNVEQLLYSTKYKLENLQ
jgi:DNA-binding ferritin-like protein